MIKKIKIIIILLAPVIALAEGTTQRKIGVSTGFYSYSGTSSTGSVSLSNIGAYHFNFMQQVYRQLAIGIGYTVIMADGFGGDLAFGVDIGMNYFPITGISNSTFKTETKSIIVAPVWKPYVGFSFHQRQYQSISTSYAGFGLLVGVEHHWRDNLSFNGDLRMVSLVGSKDSSASEMTMNIGITFDL